MLLDVNTWIYSKLNASSQISSLAGGLVYFYPNDFTKLGVLSYRTNQQNTIMDYFDDIAKSVDVTVDLDYFCDQVTDAQPILEIIEGIMSGLFFNLNLCQPIPEPETKIQHYTLNYTRQGITADCLT
jgi:hypothetical protein